VPPDCLREKNCPAPAPRHRVGQGFGNPHAGDARNVVVQAFKVLHVQRGPDIDAGFQQLRHILPALVVAAARRVGMRQLVDQKQGRAPCQRRIHVKFLQHLPAIRYGTARQHRQRADHRLRAGAPVRLHHADQHIAPVGQQPGGGGEHLPGFAHARGGAQKNLEAPFAFARCRQQQCVGIGSRILSVHEQK
jgi:hypothetical protein